MTPAATTMRSDRTPFLPLSLIPRHQTPTLERFQIHMIKRLIAGVAACVLIAVQAMAQSSAPGEVVLRAAATTAKAGAWSVFADAGASGGNALWLPDAGVPKLATASATP